MQTKPQGTNVEAGKKLLELSGLPIATADDLKEAAKKVVEALHGHSH
jgi:succinyl-CoA synthetase beta subunit